jgi:hypothetical protein
LFEHEDYDFDWRIGSLESDSVVEFTHGTEWKLQGNWSLVWDITWVPVKVCWVIVLVYICMGCLFDCGLSSVQVVQLLLRRRLWFRY